jgi:hypothetical protein
MKAFKLSLSIVLLCLFSCEKEVQIDIPGHEEQLVIDGFIETDQPPFILLSKSKDIYATTDMASFLNGFVSGAKVTVSDGTNSVQLVEICSDNLPAGTEELAASFFGISVDDLAKYHLCAYTTFDASIFGKVGKTYALTVEYEGKVYTSSTTILAPTPLNSVFWKPEKGLIDYGYAHAWLTDPPALKDAYKWEAKCINIMPDGKPRDANFSETFNPVTDDEFFNGLTFEFFYENPQSYDDVNVPDAYKGYYKLGDTVVIKFSKMDYPVFEFLSRKYIQLQTGGNPFASPTNIPTNIAGGALGVWAGFSTYFDTLVCVP